MIRDGTTTIIMGIFSFLAGCGYTPAPANFRLSDKLLFARGWSEAELRKIIADFEHMYTGRLPASFSNNIDSDEHGVLRVSLPNDIEPRFFAGSLTTCSIRRTLISALAVSWLPALRQSPKIFCLVQVRATSANASFFIFPRMIPGMTCYTVE
jgi:hypothetical protein